MKKVAVNEQFAENLFTKKHPEVDVGWYKNLQLKIWKKMLSNASSGKFHGTT